MRPSLKTALILLLLSLSVEVRADVITIDFEGIADSTALSSQFPGLQFTNAIVFTAGLTLNEFEFPPHSGSNVASDAGGPVTILFSTPVLDVSAFFTYSSPVVLDAFDSLDQSVGTTASAFSSNFVSSGNPPNELLQLSYAGGISSVTFMGAANGSSFVFDDLTYATPTSTATPEPSPAPIVLSALLLIGGRLLIRARSL